MIVLMEMKWICSNWAPDEIVNWFNHVWYENSAVFLKRDRYED